MTISLQLSNESDHNSKGNSCVLVKTLLPLDTMSGIFIQDRKKKTLICYDLVEHSKTISNCDFFPGRYQTLVNRLVNLFISVNSMLC